MLSRNLLVTIIIIVPIEKGNLLVVLCYTYYSPRFQVPNPSKPISQNIQQLGDLQISEGVLAAGSVTFSASETAVHIHDQWGTWRTVKAVEPSNYWGYIKDSAMFQYLSDASLNPEFIWIYHLVI